MLAAASVKVRHENSRSSDVITAAFSPDGRVLAVVAYDEGIIRIHDAPSGRLLVQTRPGSGGANYAYFGGGGRKVLGFV